jgi:hypothetical protein
MSDSSKSLTRKQDLALEALIGSPTLTLAAAKAGVTERTIYRWITTDDSFKSEYLKLRREILSNAVFQLQKASNNAVNTLISVMNDLGNPASARVTAAVKILELSFRGIEIDELEQRVSVLEEDRANQNLRGPNEHH